MKIIRLTESELTKIVRGVIREHLEKLDDFSTKVDGNIFFLKKDGEGVVGSVRFSKDIQYDKVNNQKHIVLYGLIIYEQHRGKGYSKILMEKVLEYLKDKVDIVDLHVMEDNKPAMNLYKSFGFEIYDGTGQILFMSKKF